MGGRWSVGFSAGVLPSRPAQHAAAEVHLPAAIGVAGGVESVAQGEAQSARVAGVIVTQGQTGLHQLMQLLAGGIPFDFPSA